MSQTLEALLSREREKNEDLLKLVEKAGQQVYAAMESDSTPYAAYNHLEDAWDNLCRALPKLRKLGTRQTFHNLPSMVSKLTGKGE